MWLNLCLAFSLCWAAPFRGRGLASWAEAFVGNTVQGQEGREVKGLMSQIISRRKKIWKARRMDLVPVTSQALSRTLLFASSFNITMRSVYYSHFPGEIMEAQRGRFTCRQWLSWVPPAVKACTLQSATLPPTSWGNTSGQQEPMFGSSVKLPFWPMIPLSFENSSWKMIHRELRDCAGPSPQHCPQSGGDTAASLPGQVSYVRPTGCLMVMQSDNLRKRVT